MLRVLQSEFLHEKHLIDEEESKKVLVVNTLTAKLSEEDALSSEFPDIVYLATALKVNDDDDDTENEQRKLVAELISGGKTNYSFRISVASDPSKAKAVYVKLFMPHASWDVEKNYKYDISRASSEFEMLRLFNASCNSNNNKNKDEPPLVVTPYLVLDVEGGCKMLVAQWAFHRDEQWANQFIEGQVDMRVVPKVARAFARVNSQVVDPAFNDSVRHNVLIIPPMVKTAVSQMVTVPDEDCDALMKLFKQQQLDQDHTLEAIVDAYMVQMQTSRECLCQVDSHPFNVLVEPKRDDECLEQSFGPDASFCICDWEMSLMGPLGKDAGTFMAYPAACALCLATQGNKDEAHELLYATLLFWESYAQTLAEESGKDEEELRRIYRVVLGMQGAYQLFYLYILGVLADTLPMEGMSTKQASNARAAIGVVGWNLLRCGYDHFCDQAQLDLKGLQEYYKETMTTQINELLELSKNEKHKPRRASLLRHLPRRVTDASVAEEAANRVSIQTLDWSYHKRVSSAFDTSELGASMTSFIDDDEDIVVTEEMRQQFFHDYHNSMDGMNAMDDLDDSDNLEEPE